MENNDLKEQKILKEESNVKQEQVSTFLNETKFNQSLPNDQKLEYLSKLIQDVEQNLELNGTSKVLIKRQ